MCLAAPYKYIWIESDLSFGSELDSPTHSSRIYVACSMLTKSVRCACCTYHCHILKCVKNERGVKYPNAAHWTCKISTFYEARCYSVLLSDLCVVFTFAGIAMPYHMWTYCCSFIFIFRASANRPTEADTTVYAVLFLQHIRLDTCFHGQK